MLLSAVPEAIVFHHVGRCVAVCRSPDVPGNFILCSYTLLSFLYPLLLFYRRWLFGQTVCSLFIFINFLGINAGSTRYFYCCTVPRADHILAQSLKGRSSSSAAPIETIQPTGERLNTRLSFSCRTNRHPVAFTKREPTKVAEISGDLFASCSNAPKRGKKCDEFESLYQNILKLLFCGHISLLQRKTTPLQIPPHMGKRYAIWRRSRIDSALVRVGQPICSGRSAMATYLFHRSGLKAIVQFVS